jgi:glycolate oxidase iron-sulfur subunit
MQEKHSAKTPVRAGFEEIYSRSLDCVHCGLCLPTCPTYVETGREVSSPRGRIYLMRGVAEGRIPLGDVVAEEASLCLGCRACETACPSGVRYGSMIERLRHEVQHAGLRSSVTHRVERFALRHIVPQRRRLRLAVELLGLAQRLGLDRLGAWLLPAALRDAPRLLPPVPPRRVRAALPELVPAQGARRGRVAFFTGCVMSELFAETNAATVRVLAREGFEVWIPRTQRCCGALQAHAGDAPKAHALARENVRAFAAGELDALVTNSAGCGAALRDLGDWLPGEGEPLAARVRDVCEWLDGAGLRAPLGRFEARVCYDDPCHLVHGQRVEAAPRRLLAAIPGLSLVSHENPGACCGAAGTYNLTQPAMSRAVLARKIASLAAADPDVVATGNPGCLMQLRAGLAGAGLRARALHPVEILDAAQRAGEPGGSRLE